MRIPKKKNYKEIFEYKHCSLLRKEGVFLQGRGATRVSLEGLPKDIYVYYIQKSRSGKYTSVSKNPLRDCAGVCFLKEEISFNPNQKSRNLNGENEFIVKDDFQKEEEFSYFFGVRLSLDKQISLADESRFSVKENNNASGGSDSEIGDQKNDKQFLTTADIEKNSNK